MTYLKNQNKNIYSFLAEKKTTYALQTLMKSLKARIYTKGNCSCQVLIFQRSIVKCLVAM